MPREQHVSRNNDDNLGRFRGGGAELTVDSFMTASPQHYGNVLKLHIPPLYSILPLFVQRFIQKIPYLASWLAPTWKSRQMFLLGSYLYKFALAGGDDDNNNKKNSPPKGSPIPIDSVQVYTLQNHQASLDYRRDANEEATVLQHLPPETSRDQVFCISTLRAARYYVADTPQQASEWVVAVEQARQEAVTRQMGHAPAGSFPAAWTYYDAAAQRLCKYKDRIRHATAARELEMHHLNATAEGAIGARGYFG